MQIHETLESDATTPNKTIANSRAGAPNLNLDDFIQEYRPENIYTLDQIKAAVQSALWQVNHELKNETINFQSRSGEYKNAVFAKAREYLFASYYRPGNKSKSEDFQKEWNYWSAEALRRLNLLRQRRKADFYSSVI